MIDSSERKPTIRIQKPRVLAEFSLTHHAVIEASAGTGKTYALEHLVVDLLLEAGADLSELLVVTFTEKAARELKARVRETIRRMLRTTPDNTYDGDDPAWTLDAQARLHLESALASFDTATISTIHAFCRRILTDSAFENRRLFAESLVDGKQAFRRAFLHVLRTRFARAPERLPYLDAWLDGSDLERLIELLFETHQRRGTFWPKHDEARLTATLRALSRLELEPGMLRPQLAQLKLAPATQKAILNRTLKLRRMLVAHRDQPDAFLGAFLGALEAEEGQPGGFIDFVIDRLGPAVGDRGVLFEYVRALEKLRKETPPLASAIAQLFLPEVREELARSKAALGELDFDDMLDLVRSGLEGPGGDSLAEALQTRFRFVLIDEFQDTDPIQWRVFERAFLHAGNPHPLFVIGDPKQAIYGFRGADIHTYLAACDRLYQNGGQRVHLIESYRSGPGLIRAVNRLLDQSRPVPFFSGSIRYDHPVVSGRPDLGGLIVHGHTKTPIHVFRLIPSGEAMNSSDRRRTLAHRIATEIRFLLDAPVEWQTEEKRVPIGPRNIFILTRTGREGREIARYLRQAGLPNAFYRQEGLFQTSEANDVRWLLAAIAEPRARARRLRAFMGPFFAVPLKKIQNTLEIEAEHPLMQRLADWKRLADARDYERLFFTVLDESGLVRRELFLHESERELTNYLHIFEVLEAQVARSRVPLPDLIHTMSAWIEGRGLPPGEDGNIERLESERDAVQIMTMHKAKGLEAPVVFLFGGFDEPESQSHIFHDEQGQRCLFVGERLPAQAERERREEDERLMYVALTRAQARLYIPYLDTTPEGGADPSGRAGSSTGGSHHILESALHRLLTTESEAELAPDFEIEDCPEVPYRTTTFLPPETTERLRDWQPPKLSPRKSSLVDIDRLRQTRRGPPITSYSRLKAEEEALAGAPPDEGDDIVAEARTVTENEIELGGLPPGAATGRLLHDLLEVVDLEKVRAHSDHEVWGALSEVRQACIEGLARHDLPDTAPPDALRLVHTALTVPLYLGATVLDGGMVDAPRVVRELEFLYPAPGSTGEERAFVKGFIDVVFEHEERVYFLDWKSDALPSYAPEDIDTHVRDHYLLQAELYTVALVRLLKLDQEAAYEERFGGAAYAFLRGLDPEKPGQGQWFWRPTFAEVEAALLRLAERFEEAVSDELGEAP